jgi:methyl-accepting chemotaxis protein
VLRRTTGFDAREPRPALDDAALFGALERAANATQETERHAERVAAAFTRQRGHSDAAAERAGEVISRMEAASAAMRRATEVLDRLGVVALNAGLEGARTSEAHGRALALVADEVRALVGRGVESLRAAVETLEEASRGAGSIAERLDRMQREVAELGSGATAAKASVQDTANALVDLDVRLRKATGLDPEKARRIAQAGEHARGLVEALSALEVDSGPDAIDSLAPVLTRLKGMLSELAPAESPPSDPEGSG